MSRGNVSDLRDAMHRQAERRTREGIPPPPTQKSDAKPEAHEASEADTDALPHIKPGRYELAYQGAEKAPFWGRKRWVISFVVVELGTANGVVLEMYVNAPPEDAKPRRSWKFSTLYVAATGRPPPRNMAKLHPRAFLENAVFLGRVVDVTKDQHGAPVAEAARYSKVENLIGPAAGRTRGGGS